MITVFVNYDIAKINQTLQDFYRATGINMDLLREDFSSVGNYSHWETVRYCKAIQNTDSGKQACLCSDADLLKRCQQSKKMEMHMCHAGLIDISVPILYNDVIIGYIIFGQMKTDAPFSAVEDYLLNLGLSAEKMKQYYQEISILDTDRIQSISHIAQILVKHILLENMLIPNWDEDIQRALHYIHANLCTPLTIQGISKNANLSKSVLYRRFHGCFGCTVSQYINKQRIAKAKELLKQGNLSVEDVSQQAGFSDHAYFSRVFKKEVGLSPMKYKRSYLKSAL